MRKKLHIKFYLYKNKTNLDDKLSLTYINTINLPVQKEILKNVDQIFQKISKVTAIKHKKNINNNKIKIISENRK